jgi:hypothetical protein
MPAIVGQSPNALRALREALTSQCPNSMAPIVKTAAPIQMNTAALRSKMVGPFRMSR